MSQALPDALTADDLGEEHLPGVPTGMSAKRKALVDAMVFSGLGRRDAAAKIGLSDRGSRYALNCPAVLAYYKRQLAVLRESERPKSVHRLVELRDQGESKKISFESARELLRGGERSGSQVNVAVGVGVAVSPGYILDGRIHHEKAKAILKASGSIRSVFDDMGQA